MSGSATTTRRKIRRAFGSAAVETLDTQAAVIGAMTIQITHLGEHVERLERDLHQMRVRVVGLETDLVRRTDMGRTVQRRVYWLLTGRIDG